MNSDLKQRVIAWLHPEQIEKMEVAMYAENMKNHTEFIEKAVDFYLGYLNSTNSTSYLSEHLLGAISGTLKTTENRIASNLFRLTVEMAVMTNILAEGLEMSDEWLRKTRIKCINDVKRTKGKVVFEDALEQQGSDN